jgi:hypothetical protein
MQIPEALLIQKLPRLFGTIVYSLTLGRFA